MLDQRQETDMPLSSLNLSLEKDGNEYKKGEQVFGGLMKAAGKTWRVDTNNYMSIIHTHTFEILTGSGLVWVQFGLHRITNTNQTP